MANLSGRSCLITGASRGIGLAIAARFAQAGARCTLTARDEGQLKAALSSLPQAGEDQKHDYIVGDVGSETFWRNTVRSKPGIDILVNSAGQAQNSLLFSTPIETIDRIIRTNLIGVIYSTRFYTKEMIKSKEGCIINVSSALAVRGAEGAVVYSASKAGLDGLVKSVAKEVSRFNIRINNILPGYIETAMTSAMQAKAKEKALENTPLGRFGTVQEVSEAAFFLATNRFITGTNIILDGGYVIR